MLALPRFVSAGWVVRLRGRLALARVEVAGRKLWPTWGTTPNRCVGCGYGEQPGGGRRSGCVEVGCLPAAVGDHHRELRSHPHRPLRHRGSDAPAAAADRPGAADLGI